MCNLCIVVCISPYLMAQCRGKVVSDSTKYKTSYVRWHKIGDTLYQMA